MTKTTISSHHLHPPGQRCIRLRLNLKATFLSKDFAVEDFATGVGQEVNEALDGLVEKE